MLDIKMDTRESKDIISYVKRRCKGKYNLILETLPEGDYESKHCLFERKKINDLYSSIMDGRLQSQCCRLAMHDDKLAVGLLIYGNLDEFCDETRIKRRKFVNKDMVFSAIGEMISRYNLIVIWAEDYRNAYNLMFKFMEHVDKGEYQQPSAKCKPEILISRLLNINVKQYKELIGLTGGTLNGIRCASKTTLMKVKGIGEKKAQYILDVLK